MCPDVRVEDAAAVAAAFAHSGLPVMASTFPGIEEEAQVLLDGPVRRRKGLAPGCQRSRPKAKRKTDTTSRKRSTESCVAAPKSRSRRGGSGSAGKGKPSSNKGGTHSYRGSVFWTSSHRRPVALAPVVYFVEELVGEAQVTTPEQVQADRESITKLLIIAQSVGSIFCSFPSDRKALQEYVHSVDGAAVVASPQAVGHGLTTASQVEKISSYLAARVLAEQNANHCFCIHVRDMDQLVPPAHLVFPPTPCEEKPAKKGRKKKGAAALQEAPEEVMSSVERLKALHQWRTDALKESQRSLERNIMGSNVHAITRLRLRDPVDVDITVVQSCGGRKEPEDVLAALQRFTKGQLERGSGPGWRSKEEEEIMKSVFLAAFAQQAAEKENFNSVHSMAVAGLLSPFTIKPLLTVHASCLPRREEQIGLPISIPRFCREPLAQSSSEPFDLGDVEAAPDASAMAGQLFTQTAAAEDFSVVQGESEVLSSSEENQVDELLRRHGIPSLPRHTTRMTFLMEHNELEVGDLLSMAELTTVRKGKGKRTKTSSTTASQGDAVTGEAPAAVPQKKDPLPRIYCLITDGSRL